MISKNEIKRRLKTATELCGEIYNLMDFSDENIPDIDCHLERAMDEVYTYMNILSKNILDGEQ